MNPAGREQDINSLLSSCIGFFPTAPLGVNSYYPWGLGRFTQEDAIEGSATLLASQNRYVYCQNDPVSLIDPTGYSPENTGTPSRFGQGNPANYSSSQHACIVSPHDGFNAKSGYFDGELAGKSLPSLSMPGWDGCYEVEDVSHELGENSPFTAKYRMTINGHQVDIYVNEEGNFFVVPTGAKIEYDPKTREFRIIGGTAEQIAIANGIEQGLNDIKRRGGDLSSFDIKTLLQDVANFAKEHLGTFFSIYTGNDPLTTFFKHAVVRGAIAQKMGNAGLEREHQVNQITGFWVSFFAEEAEKLAKKMGRNPVIIPFINLTGSDVMSLVDIANLIKGIMATEHYYRDTELNPQLFTKNHGLSHTNDWSLMQLNETWFPPEIGKRFFSNLGHLKNEDWRGKHSDVNIYFFNIAGGVGHLFSQVHYLHFLHGSKYFDSPLTIDDWLLAASSYNRGPKNYNDQRGQAYRRRVRLMWKTFFGGR